MSARQSVYVSLIEHAEPPPSPNATVAAVTAEIRLFYPPNQIKLAREMLDRAYLDAQREITKRMETTAWRQAE